VRSDQGPVFERNILARNELNQPGEILFGLTLNSGELRPSSAIRLRNVLYIENRPIFKPVLRDRLCGGLRLLQLKAVQVIDGALRECCGLKIARVSFLRT